MDDMTDDTATVLPTHQVNAADRLQRFREDDEALAELAEIVHKRAMAQGESANPSGHLDLKIRERRAAMWGYDSPVRFDMVMMEAREKPSGHEQMVATLNRFFDQLPPVRKALCRRLHELTPEAALELLGPPQVSSDGDGPGDVPLSPDGPEPSH